MRILVAHNRYQHRGGEDAVVESEIELLRSNGHEVELFERENTEIGAMSAPGVAIGAIWARASAAEIERRIDAFRPDVLHAHNTFPLISPAALWVASARGVPVVQTLHNFRLICPQAMLLREGRVCEDCVGRLPWPSVVHGCYQGSRLKTTVVATMVTLHRGLGTWHNRVSRYIALNEFCRRKFIEGGLPAARIVVKPNFVDRLPPPIRPRAGLLYVGRLSPEKGLGVLADALVQLPQARLRVAGAGPAAASIAGTPGATLLGALPIEQVLDEMASASALVLPSLWYENFPRTLVEAFASGLPVIASRLGAMAELIDDERTGLLFEPGSAVDLAGRIRWAQDNPDRMAEMGRLARLVYEAHYAPAQNLRMLTSIYQDAIGDLVSMMPARPQA